MVITGRVTTVTGKTFTVRAPKAGAYTIHILPSTIIRGPKSKLQKIAIKSGMSVTAQGFVRQRTIEATRITVLGAFVTKKI
jgi:hypothetical protein